MTIAAPSHRASRSTTAHRPAAQRPAAAQRSTRLTGAAPQRPPRPPARGARLFNVRSAADLSASTGERRAPTAGSAMAPGAAARRTSAGQPVRLTHRGRRLRRTVVVVLALMITLVVLSVGLGAVSSASEGSDGPTTRTVVVQPGQTLWSLASEALPGMDPREAVSRVADLNGLGPSSRIVTGQPLLLPLGG
ncbi:MAG: LysM peptidoglycan-binding domain-containing protein [Candidatus Nanopelagicales bacterium]